MNVARFLLDTNICIYIRRRRPPAVLSRFRQLKPAEAVLSVITYGELAYGAEKSRFREQARRQLAELAESGGPGGGKRLVTSEGADFCAVRANSCRNPANSRIYSC